MIYLIVLNEDEETKLFSTGEGWSKSRTEAQEFKSYDAAVECWQKLLTKHAGTDAGIALVSASIERDWPM